jgi:hypothetical protein
MAHGGLPAGECAWAAWHRPKPFTCVISLRCTVPAARRPRTTGFPGASACARGPGTAGPTWHAPAQRARELAKSV